MTFDEVLEDVGGFGLFQVLVLALLYPPRMLLPCNFLLNNFIAAVPPHHCDVGAALWNLTLEQRLRAGVPAGPDGSPASCVMFTEPRLQPPSDGSNGTEPPTVPCQSGFVYDNSTFASTVATEWDLVCDRKSLTKTCSTIFFMGVMTGAAAFGYFSDKYGRRTSLLVAYFLALAFGFSSAFANSFVLFAVLRFFTGFGLTGISITTIVLSIEWADTGHRALMSVLGGLSWPVGNMMLAGFAFVFNDWRALTMMVTAPLGLGLLTWWWVPESARWLSANGKVERAQFYLDKCAKFNKREKRPSQRKLETLSNTERVQRQDNSYTYLHLIKTPRTRRVTLLAGIVGFGVASTYYGISLNITGFGLNIYLTQFIYAAIELPAKLMIYFLLDVVGRRRCQAGTLLLTGGCIALNIFIPKDLWLVRAVVAVVGKGLSEASFTVVFLYVSELYPTVIRQNGLGYANFMSRVGMSVAPLILLLEDVWPILPQIVLSTGAVLSGLASLLLSETLNERLPETIADVEKPRTKGSSLSLEPSGLSLETKSTTETL